MNTRWKRPSERTAPDTSLTADARRMVDFLARWYRFGGGRADDIMVDFGVTEAVFFSRVLVLLQRSRTSALALHSSEIQKMKGVARFRLIAAGGRPLP